MLTHGISEFHQNEDAVDLLAEEVREVGFTVVEGVFAEAQVAEMRERIDEIYEQQVEEIGGLERLSLINDVDVARCLLSYDDIFVEMASNQHVLEVVHRFLGEYI